MSDSEARLLGEPERRLIERLIYRGGGAKELLELLKDVKVVPMNDGGMGSLRFVSSVHENSTRKMGRCLSQLEFEDADGVKVIASLDLDQWGDLLELDLWKVNSAR